MSAKHLGLASGLRPKYCGISATERNVLIVLADRAGADDDLCWPSKADIAECTGLNASTVDRTLTSLIEKGFVSFIPQTRANGSSSSNLYTVHLAVLIAVWDKQEAARRAKRLVRRATAVEKPDDQVAETGASRGEEGCTMQGGRGAPCTPQNQEYITKDFNPDARASEAVEKPGWTGDPSIRTAIVGDKRCGLGFAASYLDTASPGPDGSIVTKTRFAADKLRACDVILARGIRVTAPP